MSSEMRSLAVNCTAEYARLHPPLSRDVYLNIITSTGVGTKYYTATEANPTCTGSVLNQFSIPFGKCFKNYIGTPPNCTIFQDCLINNQGSFEGFGNCMVPPAYIYITVAQYNISAYKVNLFVDENCLVPFIFLESLSIPFGCQPPQFYDENSNFCNVTQTIFPVFPSTPSATLWILVGSGIAAIIVLAVLAIILYAEFA